jgi:ubiquinone/menaquinone biosynthesis C-methylase UbiE
VLSYEHLDAIRVAEIERVIPLIPKNSRILDVGGGTGRQALELSRHGFAVTAIDLAFSNYADRRVFPIIDYDGATIPLADASVEVVFSSNVLEHVLDLKRMHAEMRRVLAPHGKCIHVLPTHAWRFWTTLAGYPDALLAFVTGAPALLPRAAPGKAELRRLARAWYHMARAVGGRCIPRRHGERGNVISEMWRFHPSWWRRNFRENGFTIVRDEPMGMFCTGHMVLGTRMPMAQRERLAQWLGSAHHLFVLEPAEGASPR